jgi:diguanylate cyclase (GGDEF)-like protein
MRRRGSVLEPARAFLLGGRGDRARYADMHRRFAAAPFFGAAIGGTSLLSSLWVGWRLVGLVLLAVATMGLAVAWAPRSRTPEIVGAAAFVLLELNLGLSVLVSGGAQSPLLPLMVVPVFTQAVCFRPQVTSFFVGLSLAVATAAVAGALVLEPTPAIPAAVHLVAYAALLASLALAANWLASSDLSSRDDALIDELTGLLNRKALTRRFPELKAQAVARDEHLALIMCDVDHFKSVNDSHGHDRGDRVLREVADLLRRELRTSDLVYRFGGEEFLIMVPGSDAREAVPVAERLRRAVAAAESAGLRITISAGVASARGADVRFRDLVSAADTALYEAKRTGRDRVCSAPDHSAADDVVAPARLAR